MGMSELVEIFRLFPLPPTAHTWGIPLTINFCILLPCFTARVRMAHLIFPSLTQWIYKALCPEAILVAQPVRHGNSSSVQFHCPHVMTASCPRPTNCQTFPAFHFRSCMKWEAGQNVSCQLLRSLTQSEIELTNPGILPFILRVKWGLC